MQGKLGPPILVGHTLNPVSSNLTPLFEYGNSGIKNLGWLYVKAFKLMFKLNQLNKFLMRRLNK